jgi:crossover junction endonuclease EME1
MDLEASFCMESGQVKTGEDKNDTYIRMLQEIVRVTAPVAYGIAAEHPDLSSLMKALRQSGPTILQDLKVSKAVNMLPLVWYVRWEVTGLI